MVSEVDDGREDVIEGKVESPQSIAISDENITKRENALQSTDMTKNMNKLKTSMTTAFN